ncbi:MAG: tRNA epoxyqueuosine(34) reductase QueG [Rhizobiales bacterium]|nr:tRNA epoxyqueuosine(34) reductase QueG [Hyphomicrobiales bacterium]
MTSLENAIANEANRLGFAACRIASLDGDWPAGDHLRAFVAEGRQGDMDWLATTLERRADPRALWPKARSAIMLAVNYGQDLDPLARLDCRDTGVISLYALGRDYHDVVKGKLKLLAAWFARRSGADVKVFVDTAPLMEKPLAAKAGLGWQGKHTNLLSRDLGSWFFIGAILTTAELVADAPEADHCGSCRACLDICPTRAFPVPYQLDARRCISYLTIEHKGHIAREFREAMGNRIYGCDDCLAVCPWNKFAKLGREARLAARQELVAPKLASLVRLDDQGFRRLFSGSPVKRTGRDRFIRNVLIAIGNSGDTDLKSEAGRLLADASVLVRAMAVWALGRLATQADFARLRSQYLPRETDPVVRAEWQGN